MRSILEKALIALLNEEKDKADALFHDFILERSRQIHESLRQGEDFVLDESWENDFSVDEMFSEADLADDEEVVAEADDEVAADDDTTVADDDFVSDDAAEEGSEDDVDADADADSEEEPAEETIEDRVSDLEAELQRLTAEFDAVLGDDEEAVVGDDEFAATDDEFAPADDVEEGSLELTQTEDGALDIHHDVTDEDFESLGESALDNLEKVAVPANGEGKFLQDGKAQVNTKSPTLSKPVEQRQAGEPVKIKAEEHKGYERESAPKVSGMKKRQNTLAKADAQQSGVKKEGDASALINTGKEDKSAQHSLFDKKYK